VVFYEGRSGLQSRSLHLVQGAESSMGYRARRYCR
jgi:hypothetical protein